MTGSHPARSAATSAGTPPKTSCCQPREAGPTALSSPICLGRVMAPNKGDARSTSTGTAGTCQLACHVTRQGTQVHRRLLGTPGLPRGMGFGPDLGKTLEIWAPQGHTHCLQALWSSKNRKTLHPQARLQANSTETNHSPCLPWLQIHTKTFYMARAMPLVSLVSWCGLLLAYLMMPGSPGALAPGEGPQGGPPSLEDGLGYLVEGEEEDAIAAWKGREAWDDFPNQIIPWPLSTQEATNCYYSMANPPPTLDTSIYDSQVAQLTKHMKDPPLNKASNSPWKRPKLAAYKQDTIDTRLKNVSQFVGFCYHHLDLPPTLEHCMDPQCVAKFWGFLVARGLKASSINTSIKNLAEIPLYMEALPHITHTYPLPFLEKLHTWYGNLGSKLHFQAKAVAVARPPQQHTISLHSIWEASRQEWDDLLEEVSWEAGWCEPGLLASNH